MHRRNKLKQISVLMMSLLVFFQFPLSVKAETYPEGRVGHASGVNYYYIRNTASNAYLTAPANVASGYTPYVTTTFAGRASNKQSWKVIKNTDGTFYITPKDLTTVGLDCWSSSLDVKLYNTSAGASSTKWKLFSNRMEHGKF